MTKPTPTKPAKKQNAISPRDLREARQALIPFKSAPFPYTGLVPSTGKPFLDIVLEDRSGRSSPRIGQIFWADEIYNDSRVLLDLPQGFSTGRPGVMIVFLHGNGATLERDVVARQQVPRQVRAAGLNSVLVAPQFAVDAADSSAGAFWQPGAFTAFLDEAAGHLARLAGNEASARYFRDLPIVLVAYSGGYHPAAFILTNSAGQERFVGVVLLDALYGEVGKFVDWLARPDAGFLVSIGTQSTLNGNTELQRALGSLKIRFEPSLPRELRPGQVIISNILPPPPPVVPPPQSAPQAPSAQSQSPVSLAEASRPAPPPPPPQPVITHKDFVTKGWTTDPLRDILKRLRGYDRGVR